MLLAALAALAALHVSPARAQSSAREEQVVFWPLITDGAEYRRVAYPRQVDPIRVLADTPVVLEPRRSQVYFWPLTREYLADFSALNEALPGTLEIVAGNGEARRIIARRYTLWNPDGVAAGRSELLFDEVAQQVYELYVRDARLAAEAARAFEQRRAEHHARVDAWLKQAAARVQPLPPPPPEFTEPEPEPYRGYATELQEAPIVSLPPGEYRVRWRGPDGALVAGGERRLVSFAPRRRAIGYRLVPESRWTQPESSYNPDEALYLTGERALFLQPVVVEEYNAALYTRLFRPQSLESPDPSLHVWVPRGAVGGARLGLWRDGQPVEAIPELPYRVVQVAGTARGYTIEPFDPAGSAPAPDFVAMRLPAGAAVSHLSLLGSDGAEVPHSRRAVRTVQALPDVLIYLPAAIPLLIASVVRFRQRSRRPPLRQDR